MKDDTVKTADLELQGQRIHELVFECHGRSRAAGWYTNLKTLEPLDRNLGEMMALMHSEVSEMLEAVRKTLPSDKIPEFTGEEEEAADLLIRLMDYCGYRNLRIGAAYVAKLLYNANRPDHKLEARAKADGKQF